jgi:uncharacterized protein (TIGR02996 family)
MAEFRYFELIDEDAGRYAFWEIALEGPALHLRHGAVGTAGKHEVETCASEAIARSEYQLRIGAQLAAGFRECSDRRLDARTRDLEAAIAADPDDLAAYEVYADWIQTLGDPRGGLIVAQLAAERSAAARAIADAYLGRHADVFLGPLADLVGYDGAPLEPTWRHGFIRAARFRLHGAVWATVRRAAEPPACERVLEMTLDHASARWLSELAIETVDPYIGIQPMIDVLAARSLPLVRALEIGEVGELRDPRDEFDGGDYYYGRPNANLARLWAALPRLRRLAVKGDPADLGFVSLPELEHLAIDARSVAMWGSALGGARLPALQRLEVRLQWTGGPDTATDLEPAVRAFGRQLDHFAITNLHSPEPLCAVLAQVRRPSLRTLDLVGTSLTDSAAEILAESALELDILDVSQNLLTDRGIRALEGIAKLVIAERQR